MLNIKKNKGESLWDNVFGFNKEMLQVDDTEEKVIMAALMAGLLPFKFFFSLSKNLSSHMADLMLKGQQQMNIEDTLSAQWEWEKWANSQFDKRKRES